MKKTNKKGFTIVELVIVIAVIAILAAVLIPTFSGVVQRANESAALQEAKTALGNALSMSENASLLKGTRFYVAKSSIAQMVGKTKLSDVVGYRYVYNQNQLQAEKKDLQTLDPTHFGYIILNPKIAASTAATAPTINEGLEEVLNLIFGSTSAVVEYATDSSSKEPVEGKNVIYTVPYDVNGDGNISDEFVLKKVKIGTTVIEVVVNPDIEEDMIIFSTNIKGSENYVNE